MNAKLFAQQKLPRRKLVSLDNERGAQYSPFMHESEYKRLKRKIQAEYDEKIKALETVWTISGGAKKSPANNSVNNVGKGALRQAVRNALPKLGGDFTAKDVEKQMQVDNSTLAATVKRASISSTLNRLALDKEIVVVLIGKGKRSTTYRRD
jgi:hypothetical protein